MDVFDRMGNEGHPEEDYLERYLMKTCSEQESEVIEEHLLICEKCCVRLHEAEELVSLLKIALPLGPRSERERLPRWNLSRLFPHPAAMAMAGCAALVILVLAGPALVRRPAIQEQQVTLTATRGQPVSASTASSDRLLDLRLDTSDLNDPLEAQVVDSGGGILSAAPITQVNPTLKLKQPLPPGQYWVRINSRLQDHASLREFQLTVE